VRLLAPSCHNDQSGIGQVFSEATDGHAAIRPAVQTAHLDRMAMLK
jgi:hypothetical protein